MATAANKLTTSGQAIFLQSTAPLYLLFLAPLVLHERLKRSELVMVAFVAVGAVLLLFGEQRVGVTAPDPVLGNWIGMGSGVCWALTLTGFRWLGKHRGSAESPAAVIVAGNAIAFVVCLPMALPVAHVTNVNVTVVFYLGVVQIGLAYMALTRSIRHVPAVEAATLLLLEPVLNPVWSWLLQGERLTASALSGGMLIVGAILGSTVYQARKTATARSKIRTVHTNPKL